MVEGFGRFGNVITHLSSTQAGCINVSPENSGEAESYKC
jgi:hypothetical protein